MRFFKMSTDHLGDIKGIHFGILSEKEILALSVAEITSSKKSGSNTVYDGRLCSVDNLPCETCGQDDISCPGHFGHIVLCEPIVHPLYVKKVISILRCVCVDCKKIVISPEHLELKERSDPSKMNFNQIKKVIAKVSVCSWCKTPQPSFKYNSTENTINMMYEDDGKKISVEITPKRILSIFRELTDDDVRFLGMKPEMTHPSSMIITVLPVLPPPGRPFVRAAGNLCDDDLSNQYSEIVKVNNKLYTTNELDSARRLKLLQTLKFRVATTFNNSAGRAKHTTNGRPVKCIKSRISGKDGQMRGNIMGRRSNQTARTVIGPDTSLRNGEMSIPKEVSRILTIPEVVNSINSKYLHDIVNAGDARFLIRKGVQGSKETKINLDHARKSKGTRLCKGDKIIAQNGDEFIIGDNSPESHDRIINGVARGDAIIRDGVKLDKVQSRKIRKIRLEEGDTVERCLRDGDIVVLNRQPTLHKASMQAFNVLIRPGKTFRFNLACTKAFNADFDGDEMNIHVAQSPEARAEIEYLSKVKHNLITGQTSKMNIVIVQDGVLGSYLMTKKDSRKLTKGQFFNAMMRTSVLDKCVERMLEIQDTLDRVNQESPGRTTTTLLSGRGLVSCILPRDFHYKKKVGKEKGEEWLEIEEGVILKGCLSKRSIGCAHGCIPHYIHNEHGAQRCIDFLDDLQFITNAFLEITSFTVGFRDCLPKTLGNTSRKTVQDTIYRCFMEADAVVKETRNETVRESRVNTSLGKAKDIGLRIATENLDPKNNFISTVTGGSKGDFFNIAQITGLLGQQNISGQRLPLFFNNEMRSLPHYPLKPANEYSPLEKYESRGFISSSFIDGLNPREFFFHSCSGREGMSDTAVGTAVSGYIQRKIVKLQEDMRVQYDGTVRDETGRIFQLKYGNHGLNQEDVIKTGTKSMWFSDLQRVAERLNQE